MESRLLETRIDLFVNSHVGPGLASRLPCVSMGTRPQRPRGSPSAGPARRAPAAFTSFPKQHNLPPSQLGRRVPTAATAMPPSQQFWFS